MARVGQLNEGSGWGWQISHAPLPQAFYETRDEDILKGVLFAMLFIPVSNNLSGNRLKSNTVGKKGLRSGPFIDFVTGLD